MFEDKPIHWEEIACPLCDLHSEEELLAVAGEADRPFRLVRCGECGMVYLNPRPDVASIGRFYPEDYEPYQPPRAQRGGWWKRLRGPDRDSLTGFPLHGNRRLLDYGCGSGWYAHRMRERGWRVTGMDMSPHAVEQARSHFGLEVIHGTLPHAEVAPESFDVITMGAVLEHIHWPHQVIAAVARALAPGGRLVISVPNIASWGYRTFGKDWWPLELPRHLLHFTPATLRMLVEAHDLELLECRMLGRTGWMRRSLENQSRRGGTAKSWLTSLGRSRMIQSWLTRWTVWAGQADCLLAVAKRPAATPATTKLAA
jgi:SAM-dependent methyltransferase